MIHYIFEILVLIFTLYILDKIFLSYIKDEKLRYYIIHFFVNLIVTITSFRSFYEVYLNNENSLIETKLHFDIFVDEFNSYKSKLPILIVAALHIYHCLFFNISNSDIYHHITFAFSLLLINLCFNWGKGHQSITFVICGLPGVFEYFIMSLYKCNYINKINMRYMVTFFHLTLRLPLGLYVSHNMFKGILKNKCEQPFFGMIVGTLTLLNVTQYAYLNCKSSYSNYFKVKNE